MKLVRCFRNPSHAIVFHAFSHKIDREYSGWLLVKYCERSILMLWFSVLFFISIIESNCSGFDVFCCFFFVLISFNIRSYCVYLYYLSPSNKQGSSFSVGTSLSTVIALGSMSGDLFVAVFGKYSAVWWANLLACELASLFFYFC